MLQETLMSDKALGTIVMFDLSEEVAAFPLGQVIAKVCCCASEAVAMFPSSACAFNTYCHTCACINAHRSSHQLP